MIPIQDTSSVFNVYCDESCHLEHDRQPVMLFGAVWCPQEEIGRNTLAIRKLKEIHRSRGELKWSKVSASRESFFLAMIDLFFSTPGLNFRCLIVNDKEKLDHAYYNRGSHNSFYYKMYYYLLRNIISDMNQYDIYLDIKDTRSQMKIDFLREVLCNSFNDFDQRVIRKIQHVRSREVELLQLADFLMGAIAYKNRNLSENKNGGYRQDLPVIREGSANQHPTVGREIQSLCFHAERGMLMADLPDFLPPILDLGGTWEEILDRLYSVFHHDFKESAVRHSGVRVIFDGRIMPDGQGKEEGFWHVVLRKDTDRKERLIDYRRAERLPWAKPMMESTTINEIRVFDYDHGTKDVGVRRYVWLADYDYVLILQKKKRAMFWVTAYYIDSDRGRRDLVRRYEQRA